MEIRQNIRTYLLQIFLFLVSFLIDSSLLTNSNVNNKSSHRIDLDLIEKYSLLSRNSFIKEPLLPENTIRCGAKVNLTMNYGFVKNPDYPNVYKVPSFCQWNIISSQPDEFITISFDELDIENPNQHSKHCQNSFDSKQCCNENYLKISSEKNEQYFCGKLSDGSPNVYISDSNSISITFNATSNQKGVGFSFSYFISPKYSSNCFSNEFHCHNGKCIPKKWHCNKKNECGDGSDELMCDSNQKLIRCGNEDNEYYHISKKCDQKFDCQNQADELGCIYCDHNQFRCQSMNKCINQSMICDGIPDCNDFSDEINCLQHCPSGKIRCESMVHCYDPRLHRCNKILDCPNGADEYNCFDQCRGKIMCASGDGCYDLEERCNGIVQCADYSDEKNCTLELCRPDKGSFLCTNGRCIPSLWTCDRSADCYDGSDEMRCLKNSVITAAIIGSLICGLLIVIAISCGLRLVALRNLERYRISLGNTNGSYHHPPYPTQFRTTMEFPFPNPGDLDASLFRLDHSVLFREPPPSYVSTMGGYYDIEGINNAQTYMDQYRRYRRQRRCRRMLRRQHRNQYGQQSNGSQQHQQQPSPPPLSDNCVNSTINNELSDDARRDVIQNSGPNETTIDVDNQIVNVMNDGKKDGKENPRTMGPHSSNNSCANYQETLTSDDNIITNIEMEPIIPPLTNFDCDSQPLIR